ncbi:MAG: histidinol dehydrogenase [Candidatus Jacksonbacteria bacterium RIFOXYC2_FULL_44_29]|nr:MAG: Histidinol dehydrogenase [Parcubacteria group bacterium GW2011_GWA2_42_28]KKT54704.1 MAG: Histidinol dehydrogenase [Parcubacteria group bacterium GW2011_GWC2_44_22]OGY75303.1 MAG: histidinol dehydrogenase [Candidatus Jacksonbacteria bacterium RIFOXYA2_FULL_43_12]OGY76213.1 MAG: histidinol dehydrogenase [Candidatus Jacksonbacteria bacterium RIFOXYB2_FULL_44_15]OGY78068.1 MAG: histidinol dehydrogenase [Candidatus Jacksonbacteria bacterium RIFOXYC2_FULL_44_29]OGY80852.1 MAG: histidinol de
MIKIYTWDQTSEKIKQKIIKRSMLDIEKIRDYVQNWIAQVRRDGDAAVLGYIRKFDNPNFKLRDLRVSQKDIKQAYQKVEPRVLKAIKRQISISKRVARARLRKNPKFKKYVPGVKIGYQITAIESAGLMIPAGQAPLPTVMQILGVNAKAAGVGRIVACFPPTGDYPEMLVAADLAGVDEIYRVGGIAGVAALAYGTRTIKSVLKIVGPGSIYTQTAKMLVYGQVDIDGVAGPSEAVILADDSADSRFVAADILARAEHDGNAAGVLITPSRKLALETQQEIKRQLPNLNRQKPILESLAKYSAIIMTKNWTTAINLTNQYAPEHLEIMTKNPQQTVKQIKNAGSIFLGSYAPVAVGDYASGTSHILPTGYWTKVASPVTPETFQKISEVQWLSKSGLANLSDIVTQIGEVEGLDAHVKSVLIRLKK